MKLKIPDISCCVFFGNRILHLKENCNRESDTERILSPFFLDDELSELLSNKNQVLCVVNSRKAANTIYKKLSQKGSFHLSTLMVPEHRMKTVEEIRKRLKGNEPCRVVSTSACHKRDERFRRMRRT